MVSLYNLVATITIKGYRCEVIIKEFRKEVWFQHREAPFDRQSVVFVCPQGNRQARMREEQSPEPLHLSNNRNTSAAANAVSAIKVDDRIVAHPQCKIQCQP